MNKMKWDTKNCEECKFWRSPMRFNRQEFCSWHKEENHTKIDKEIREQKKDRNWNRLIFGLGFLFALLGIIFSLCKILTQYYKWQTSLMFFNSILLMFFVILLCFYANIIIVSEKVTNKNLKELRTKRAEWVKVPGL